jgi:hypothetical protein
LALDNYTQVYGTDEADEPATDIVIGVGSELYSMVGLIALVILYKWAKGKKTGL